MNWWYWAVLFTLNGAPISLLLADRLLGVPGHRVIRFLGLPWLAALAAFLVYGAVSEQTMLALFGWGVLGGLLGTVALDAVRLAGLRAGAFPLDMPMMFGAIAYGLAPRLQRNVMGRLVEHVSVLPPTWHVLNGVSFGSMYTLLVGDGNWWWALGWGAAVWALMMIAMPFMMPVIRFPKWFPIVPFWAHIAMAAPIGAVAIAWVTGDQAHVSLLDQLS